MKNEKGVTLILVIMIIAVLTLLALGVLFIMSTDQIISKNDRLNKQAFYVAEAGLQEANRRVIDSYQYAKWNDDLGQTSANGAARTTGSSGDQPLTSFSEYLQMKKGWVVWDATGNKFLYQIQVPATVSSFGNGAFTARYTVWSRNNKSEIPWRASDDNDDTIEVISLGEIVQDAGTANEKILSQKSLWEEVKRITSAKGAYPQEGGSAMGGHVIIQ